MYSPPADDIDTQRMTAAHAHAAEALGVTVHGPQLWGWHGRTLGHRSEHPVHGTCWLRLLSAPTEQAGGKLWDGTELAAKAFPDVRMPALHGLHDWTAAGRAYRAELTRFIDEPVLSPDPVLRTELELTADWFTTIRSTLTKIATASTDRTAVRQQWIDRAVPQYTGRPAPRIEHWECAHGDFHAANLTNGGTLLDWEGWGLAPAATTSPSSWRTPSSHPAPPHTCGTHSATSWTPPPATQPSWWSVPTFCNRHPEATTRT